MEIAVFEEFAVVDVENRIFLRVFIFFGDYKRLIGNFASG
jgi:hypothetical protein